MVNKKFLVMLLGIIFLTSFVSAVTTEIKIKTLPDHFVTVNILKTEGGLIERLYDECDKYGDVSFTFDTDESSYDMTITVMDMYDDLIKYERYDDYTTGGTKSFTVVPSGQEDELIDSPFVEEEEEEEIVEEEEEVDEEELVAIEDTAITGFSMKEIFTDNTTYYILGGIVVLVIVVFAFRKFGGQLTQIRQGGKEIKVRKLSDIKNASLEELETNLKTTQEKIAEIKNKDDVESLKRQLEEKNKELERLKSEGKSE